MGCEEVLSGHKQATLEELRRQEGGLLVQDMSFLNYGTLPPKAGTGTVKEKVRKAYCLHATVAFTLKRRQALLHARLSKTVGRPPRAA